MPVQSNTVTSNVNSLSGSSITMSILEEPDEVVRLEDRSKWVELGRGMFSVVWKAYCCYRNGYMAVKEVEKRADLPEVKKLIPLVDHEHILKIMDVDIGRQLIINEFCSYSLQLLRDNLGNDFIPWPRCCLFIANIMGGLDYLHGRGIIHGSLRLTNVMVNDGYICKIADFGPAGSGCSAWATNESMVPSHLVYASPKLLMDPSAPHTRADDLYSCSILLYKMITNADIFSLEKRGECGTILRDLRVGVSTEGLRPDIARIHHSGQRAPSLVGTIIRTCWDGDPHQRVTANYWAQAIGADNKANLTPKIIAEATHQLQQLLIRERSASGASCSGAAKHLDPSPPVGDSVGRLSLQEDVEVTVTDRSDIEAMRFYKLTTRRSYRLSFDHQQMMVLFRDSCSGATSQIPTRNIKSAAKGASRSSVVLHVATIAPGKMHSLVLSVSSVEEVFRGLRALQRSTSLSKRVQGMASKQDEVPQQRGELRSSTGTLLNGLPMDCHLPRRSSLQPTSNPPVPNGMPHRRPQASLDRHPLQAQHQTTINVTIKNAGKVCIPAPASVPVVTAAPPYHKSILTDSEEVISVKDMTSLQGHVVKKYEEIGRRLGLDVEMEAFARDHKSMEASYLLLRTWREQNGSSATKERLARVLYESGLYEAAKLL